MCVASRPCGVSGVRDGFACGPSTLWRSEVAMLAVRRRSHLVVAWSRRMCRGLLPLCARLRWFLRESCVCHDLGSEVCCWFGWCVLAGFPRMVPWWFWWRFSQDRFAFAVLFAAVFSLMVRVVWSFGLCILVKVLPRIALLSLLAEVLPKSSALCSFRATVVLPLWFEVCCLVGLRSGEVLPGRLLALLVEFLLLWPVRD
ncbi:hypothetical protein Taro_047609 [Colocasia esculenta]|uniref:Transmembrane protein n=1 Tax=Colocasia esculenta TaxID=4460 RepID=A0A843WTD8_COLES|nr:hypothetical protein [Colocasia esculenta]